MRVLITGAYGYLGGRLCASLSSHFEVIAGARNQPLWASEILPHVPYRELDVLREGQAQEALKGIDGVIHLASLDEVEASENPDLALRVSAEGTRKVLEAAKKSGVKRFLYLSTFHVYGPDAGFALDEESLTRPAHPYGISRLAGEGFCRAANQRLESPFAVTIRLSNAYGAPVHPSVDRWTLAHNDFCRQVMSEKKIVLRSSGLQHRDLVAVEDVAQACTRLLQAEQLSKKTFQVGGGHSLSIFELAQKVRRKAVQVLGEEIAVERPEPLKSEISQEVQYSIERIQELGYQPSDQIDIETERILSSLQ